MAGQTISQTAQMKTLVAYFSWSGNTREVANQIHRIMGGDLFEIVSVDKYPSDYNECLAQARREQEEGHRPRLKSEPEDIGSYDLVFIGYPNWWDTIPMPVASFLEMCDSPRKVIAPFCTHGGDGLAQSVEDITKLCPQSRVLDGLAIRGGTARRAHSEISEWLRKTGLRM